ncbi:hypothetical protein H2200_002201 [Cladophialophora chaetospira]|uniref:Uncharacterized protein n=1 Tax=Cladophialophora chaetospira TaxID=386627 RepID=A0AA38XIE8_9EURO|nr:hypothetical protein H2200_002201 [Cladophialophora chaetospira]
MVKWTNEEELKIIQHGRDLSTMSDIRKEETGKKSGFNNRVAKDEDSLLTPKSAPCTPAPRSHAKGRGSSAKRPAIGCNLKRKRKRSRRAESESSEAEMASEPETSDSETAVESPIPRSTRSLRVRKPRVAPVTSEESDMDLEAGTKDYGSDDSNGVYEVAKNEQDETVQEKDAELAMGHGQSTM